MIHHVDDLDQAAAEHANLRARITEIDKATANLVAAIEAGTDPAVINPRLSRLRAERETVAHQLATLDAPERLNPADIDALITELGGLANVLSMAMPPEKTSVYQSLGIRLVCQQDRTP